MMFVVKGVVNLSNDIEGEWAVVSYQNTSGDHCMTFFFNKEEIFSDFQVSYSKVLANLDRKPTEILLHDTKTYLRVTKDMMEIVDLTMYTKQDKESKVPQKSMVTLSECSRQNITLHEFEIPGLEQSVRAKSHMRTYRMQGVILAMKLAWENPIRYDEVEIFPVDNYYADFEAMTDIVYLDYTIQDYTQPVKSVQELAQEYEEEEYEEEEDEEIEFDEEEQVEAYEEHDDYEEEEDEDEIEMDDIEVLPTRRSRAMDTIIPPQDTEEVQEEVEVKEETKKNNKKKDKKDKKIKKVSNNSNQPRGKDGKFTSSKKK